MPRDTRQALIDAAVVVFGEIGFANCEIDDVLQRAKVTWDLFFDHFPSKDALAGAIIEEADTHTEQAMAGAMSMPASTLENLIVASFMTADMAERNALVRTAHLLRQRTLPPTSTTPGVLSWSITEAAIKTAVMDGDLLDDVDAEATVLTIQSALLGSHLLGRVTADDAFGRIAKIWRTILRAIARAERLPYLDALVIRISEQYSS